MAQAQVRVQALALRLAVQRLQAREVPPVLQPVETEERFAPQEAAEVAVPSEQPRAAEEALLSARRMAAERDAQPAAVAAPGAQQVAGAGLAVPRVAAAEQDGRRAVEEESAAQQAVPEAQAAAPLAAAALSGRPRAADPWGVPWEALSAHWGQQARERPARRRTMMPQATWFAHAPQTARAAQRRSLLS